MNGEPFASVCARHDVNSARFVRVADRDAEAALVLDEPENCDLILASHSCWSRLWVRRRRRAPLQPERPDGRKRKGRGWDKRVEGAIQAVPAGTVQERDVNHFRRLIWRVHFDIFLSN